MWQDLENSFLQQFLEYVEETETPRLMHVWAALTGAGACLGRRVFIPWGVSDIYPNLFVLLVGPPAVRKNTPIKVIRKRVRKATNVRFATNDTGGQRQGLIVAMEGDVHHADEKTIRDLDAAIDIIDLETIGKTTIQIDVKDAHTMFAIVPEFISFIGQNALTLCTFLNCVYDGDDYDYKIRNVEYTLANPLLSILGATTPTQIADCLPSSTIGHGFTSRIIFVYASKCYKEVPIPPQLPKNLEKIVERTFSKLYYEFNGAMELHKNARLKIIDLYNIEVPLNDARFMYYLDRRQLHLLKVSMILTALRNSQIIQIEDIEQAHSLLTYTEQFMPDALGEFGMSPIGAAKQKMLEFIMHVNGPVTKTILWAMMQRDLKNVDFNNSLLDLVNAKKVIALSTKMGEAYIYNDKEQLEKEELLAKIEEEE